MRWGCEVGTDVDAVFSLIVCSLGKRGVATRARYRTCTNRSWESPATAGSRSIEMCLGLEGKGWVRFPFDQKIVVHLACKKGSKVNDKDGNRCGKRELCERCECEIERYEGERKRETKDRGIG